MKDMNKNSILVTVIVAVLVGGAAFLGGMKYQQSKTALGFRQFAGGTTGNQAFGGRGAGFGGPGGATGARGGANGANAFRPVQGQILSQDDKSITVKLQDGSSKIVLLPESATYNKTTAGAKSDLKVGDNVAVFGMTNPDGSVTAQSVQENPMFGMRNGAATPSASPATK